MKVFLTSLKIKNTTLYYFGWIMFIGAIACCIASFFDKTIILGIDAWIKPTKFYLSIGIMAWTIGWLAYHLSNQNRVKIYSWILVATMAIEMLIITFQAAMGQRSHFNESTIFNAVLFSIMGISITIFVACTALIGSLFFSQKFTISPSYLLSIRLALIFFVVFAFEGWFIVTKGKHTIGAADGSAGLPFLNWSKQYGDLRVAHFFGMHALQIFPLVGYYYARKKTQVILFAIIYFFFVTALLLFAIKGLPFIAIKI